MTTELEDSRGLAFEPLDSPERMLAGKKALVIGGNRDVGGGIVPVLTKNGVDVAISYHDKTSRAKKLQQSTADDYGDIVGAFPSDISIYEGRQELFSNALHSLGGEFDYLILSTSGSIPELNELASNHFLDMALQYMRRGGSVVRLQSVPGHFFPQLNGAVPLGAYQDIAGNKSPDLKSLRKRMSEMEDYGIRFIEICPPVVPKTGAAMAAKLVDHEAHEKHYIITDKLGLPRTISTNMVGQRVVELFKDEEVPSGHTEFFNGVTDAQTELEELFGESYVSTFEELEEINGQVHGIGRSLVSLDQATRTNDKGLLQRLKQDAESGFIGILRPGPEYQQIRAAVDTIDFIERRKGLVDGHLRLAGFDRATFTDIDVSGDSPNLVVKPLKNPDGSYGVEILRENTVTGYIKNLRLRDSGDEDNQELLETQLIQGAFQTAVIASSMEGESRGNDAPRIREIGGLELSAAGISAGNGVEYDLLLEKMGDEPTEESTVVIQSGDRIAGSISGLRII